MNKLSRFFPVIAALVLSFAAASADARDNGPASVNKKFGAVSLNDLKMDVYQADSSASAVYLYLGQDILVSTKTRESRFGTSGFYNQVQDYLQYVVKNRVRLKILDESALDRAQFAIRLNTATRNPDVLKGLKVVTYNLSPNGIVSTQMPKNLVADTQTDGQERVVSFTAPDVKVGSVIELQWETVEDRNLSMPDVYLQRDIPIAFGEFSIKIPQPVVFSYSVQGVNKERCIYEQSMQDLTRVDTYTVIDMPGLKNETACFAQDDYLTQVGYTLKALEFPETFVKRNYSSYKVDARKEMYNTNWEFIDKELNESVCFRLNNYECRWKKEVDEILAQDLTELQKITEIRNFICGKIAWNGKYSMVPEPAAAVAAAGSGSNADINAAVGVALMRGGYVVCPLFLRLRSSGDMNKVELEEYDTFAMYVESPLMNRFVLDAADPATCINSLPVDMRVENYRIIDTEGNGDWINLEKLTADSQSCAVTATLADDGTIKAEAVIKMQGGNAYDFKKFYQSFSSESAFVEEFQKQFNGYTIESCNVISGKEWSSEVSVNLTLSGKAKLDDGAFVVNPVIRNSFDAHLFDDPVRYRPIEFGHRENLSYNFVLNIPGDCVFEHVPASYVINSLALSSTVQNVGSMLGANTFMMRYIMRMNKTRVESGSYAGVQSFWEKMCGIYDEKVTVRRK